MMRMIEEDENNLRQNSTTSSSNTSFQDIRSIVTATNVDIEIIVENKTHLVIPLEFYELPFRTRSQHNQADPFTLKRNYYDPFGTRVLNRNSRLNNRPPGKGKGRSPFRMRRFYNIDVKGWFRRRGLKINVASAVISPEPFGTKFHPALPAIVSIPLDVHPAIGDEVYCFYSNKPSRISPGGTPLDFDWKLLDDDFGNNTKISFDMGRGRVVFETTELCYYVIIIREKCLEAKKHIMKRIGGRLIDPLNNIEVNFPKGSVQEDVDAIAKVYYDTELSIPEFFKNNGQPTLNVLTSTLATPIIMLEPHGQVFNADGCGVTIQLPVPDYDIIMERFNYLNPKLSIWQSCTGENEPANWERLNVPFSIGKIRSNGKQITVVSFQVEHFSFFRGVWDIISSALYEVQIGMSYLYPFVSFSMKCQATMEENSESRFGLEVICYRSDKVLPELTTYRHRVGCSNKPKLVRPGRIKIRLKSQYFEADENAGEDTAMEKEELDFRGRDFEMQYALRFKKEVDRGTFGKVIVKRIVREGNEEPLFEFNLQKYGCEGEQTPHMDNDRWSILALQELAGSLFINQDDNWKIFAKEIGFTKKEVKLNFMRSADPFIAMLTLYQQRGGTPDEFVTALYRVSRQLTVPDTTPTGSSKKSVSLSPQGSSGLGSSTSAGHNDGSDTSTDTEISQDSVLTRPNKKRSHPSISSLNRSGGSRNSTKSRAKRMRRTPKQRKNSESENAESEDGNADVEDDSGNPDEGGDNIGDKALSDTTSIYHRNDLTKLEATYLWEVSAHMETLQWRNLARTLGLDESQIINIEHLHKAHGFRECAYQMLLFWKEKFPKKCTYGVLYSGLCKEGMNCVAKKMKLVSRND